MILNEKKRCKSCSRINLNSLESLSSENNDPLYTKKICELINDQYYKRIFNENQLKKILLDLYKNNVKQNQKNLKDILNEDLNINFLNFENKINFYSKKIKKSIIDDINRGKRHTKIIEKININHFKLTPIKLYQQNLLEKYSSNIKIINDKNIFKNFNKIIDNKKSINNKLMNLKKENFINSKIHLKTTLIKKSEKKLTNLNKLTENYTIKSDKILTNLNKLNENYIEKCDKKITIFNTIQEIEGQNELKNDKKGRDRMNTFDEMQTELLLNELFNFTNFKRASSLNDDEDEIYSQKNLITEENASLVTKSNIKSSNQPRLSKENIQGLIKQSVTNVINKRKKSEVSVSRSSFKLNFNSTTSESRLSESGDLGELESQSSWKIMKGNSLNEIDKVFQTTPYGKKLQDAISETTVNSLDSDNNLRDDESKITIIALEATNNYIEKTCRREHRTMSGFLLGRNSHIHYSQCNFKFDGNYSYVDGVNPKGLRHKNYLQVEYDEILNETFLALSHMYCLKKLMDRKSLYIDTTKAVTSTSPSFSFHSLNYADGNLIPTEEFASESSQDSSVLEPHQSFDVTLINKFRAKYLISE